MCRDGYRAQCSKQHCAEIITCRDWPHMCPEHADRFELLDDDEEWAALTFTRAPRNVQTLRGLLTDRSTV